LNAGPQGRVSTYPIFHVITSRAVTIYGFISITVMLVLLVLIWFRLVPETYYWPFFTIAALLFIARIVLRVTAARNERHSSIPDNDPPA
jgi:hypothetical protein